MREMIEKFKDGSQTAIIHKDKKYSYAELYLKIKETNLKRARRDKFKTKRVFLR